MHNSCVCVDSCFTILDGSQILDSRFIETDTANITNISNLSHSYPQNKHHYSTNIQHLILIWTYISVDAEENEDAKSLTPLKY